MQQNQSEWFKSSYSAQNGNCLEARHRADGALDLRDSKNPSGPVMTVCGPEWAAFVSGVRAGRFDR
ncbi:DUF397 domain-containing protein [Streptomyces sp. B1866]|uniref:DUF397 domain-containing protein n=1 Tax=Streptomyces sp. B1866 TaxID=3075431 RepID=UPI00288D9ADA|nr:DUF397 domain-containing protein [Streptomyces sp. B1866]MDT3396207.1 DUF397 domain-containing protein [Streptomyces sp. B1866]